MKNKNKVMVREYLSRYKLFNDDSAKEKAKVLMNVTYGFAGQYSNALVNNHLNKSYKPELETITEENNKQCTIM